MDNIFDNREVEELRKLAQKGKEAKVSRIVDELSESSPYIEPLELILGDRKTHELLLRTAKNYSQNIEAICIELFGMLPITESGHAEPFATVARTGYRLLSPDHQKLKSLYRLFDCQPSLTLHINPYETNFAVGKMGNFRVIMLGLVCDFLRDSQITQHHYKDNVFIDATSHQVDPSMLTDWYKDSVRKILAQSNEKNWNIYIHPAKRKLELLETFQ